MLFSPKEKGQGLVEYALILVLVAIVVIVILALLGPAIGNSPPNVKRGAARSDRLELVDAKKEDVLVVF